MRPAPLALLALAAACASSAPSAATSTPAPTAMPADTTPATAGYRTLSFDEFTTESFLHALPVRFRVPEGYVPVSVPHEVTRTYWMSPADSARQAADAEAPLQDGFYSVTITMGVGYDQDRDVFFQNGEGAGGEEVIRRGIVEAGFTGVTMERHRINGYPVLFIEAEKDGRRATIFYLAALVDTNVVFAFYSHPTPIRDVDRERWRVFKDAILTTPPMRATRR